MKKIAYNACYGGFGISDKAVKWLIENESDNLEKDGLLENLGKHSFDSYGLRKNPSLIKVIETLSDEVNTDYSKLCISEIDENTKYRITEYDGFEEIETIDTVDWYD